MVSYDLLREIVLQGQSKAVVHVNLNGDQQELTHLQNWNSLHVLPHLPGLARGPLFTFDHAETAAPQGDREGVCKSGFGGHISQIYTQVDDGLGNLGTDSA